MLFDPKVTQRGVRAQFLRLVFANLPSPTQIQSATACPEGFTQCTLLKNGTGDVSIKFNKPWKRTPAVFAQALHTSSKLFVSTKSQDTDDVRLTVFSDAGTATDPTELHVFVIGSDTTDVI